MSKQKSKKLLGILLGGILFFANQNFLFVQAQTLAQESSAHVLNSNSVVPGEIVVKISDSVDLKEDSGAEQLVEIAKENDVAAKKIVDLQENIAVLSTSENPEIVAEKIAELSSDPRIEYAQPNFVYHSFAISSNDPDRNLQWALDNVGQQVNGVSGKVDADISAPEAWGISEGNENSVVVAVADDGVAYNHNDLAANMWDGANCVGDNGSFWGSCLHGYDFFSGDKDPIAEESDLHGTVVAGVAGALKNNGFGGMGIAPHAKIMALRIGSGNSFTTDKAVMALAFAKNNGAKIFNASWGGNQSDLLLKNAIESFGGLFVAAAGNSGTSNDASHIYPCDFDSPNIICVAATDQNDNLWSNSSYSASSVDLAAPGVNIFSTANSGIDSYALGSGTSMSAPFVSGVAALLWGHNISLSAAQVKAQILASGDSLATLNGKTLTGKRLNAFAALGGTNISAQNSNPFLGTNVSFSSKEVKSGETDKDKIKINFENIQNASQFIFSRRSDFAGASWQSIQSSVKVSLKEKGKKETFYVKFRDSNGFESNVFRKKVLYKKDPVRSIKNSKNTLKVGEILVQRGVGFSKKAEVALYFDLRRSIIKTDSRGKFIVSYKINKAPGTFSWYAVDLKTGKKSKTITYKVVK